LEFGAEATDGNIYSNKAIIFDVLCANVSTPRWFYAAPFCGNRANL